MKCCQNGELSDRRRAFARDELLQMVYDNPNKRDSWYEIMSNVMPSFKEISSDAYDLLELWCDKVDDTEERAKLILQLTEYVD